MRGSACLKNPESKLRWVGTIWDSNSWHVNELPSRCANPHEAPSIPSLVHLLVMNNVEGITQKDVLWEKMQLHTLLTQLIHFISAHMKGNSNSFKKMWKHNSLSSLSPHLCSQAWMWTPPPDDSNYATRNLRREQKVRLLSIFYYVCDSSSLEVAREWGDLNRLTLSATTNKAHDVQHSCCRVSPATVVWCCFLFLMFRS